MKTQLKLYYITIDTFWQSYQTKHFQRLKTGKPEVYKNISCQLAYLFKWSKSIKLAADWL